MSGLTYIFNFPCDIAQMDKTAIYETLAWFIKTVIIAMYKENHLGES
jgi:hypothetical protein